MHSGIGDSAGFVGKFRWLRRRIFLYIETEL